MCAVVCVFVGLFVNDLFYVLFDQASENVFLLRFTFSLLGLSVRSSLFVANFVVVFGLALPASFL